MIAAKIRIDDLIHMAKWAESLKLHEEHPGYVIELLIAGSAQDETEAKAKQPLRKRLKAKPVVGYAVHYGANDFLEGSYERVEDRPELYKEEHK